MHRNQDAILEKPKLPEVTVLPRSAQMKTKNFQSMLVRSPSLNMASRRLV